MSVVSMVPVVFSSRRTRAAELQIIVWPGVSGPEAQEETDGDGDGARREQRVLDMAMKGQI